MSGPVFEVDGRPAPAPRAPPRDALREVYEELLAIERERGFVFPETTVIVRDVRFLAEKVYGPAPSTDRDGSSEAGAALAPPSEVGGDGDDGELDDLLAELGADGGAELGAP